MLPIYPFNGLAVMGAKTRKAGLVWVFFFSFFFLFARPKVSGVSDQEIWREASKLGVRSHVIRLLGGQVTANFLPGRRTWGG